MNWTFAAIVFTLAVVPFAANVIVQLDNPVSEVSIFTDPLTAILIGRYLMALQSANQQVLGHTSTMSQSGEDANADGTDTLRFAPRIIGSIGATLTMRDEEDALGWQHEDEEVGDEEKVHDGGVHEGSETGIAL
ncbi:hypothetical protein TRAPUB_4596 [Trametes pubescens]|uniref:Uncharacterized protein n=1 Tax=Trametes pubescens TaxID=154538 RepID=A0A1M2VAI1_TRAPU|nr:hypothetical protein TRAPUB_4596 [Trametes pubescens]